MICPVYIAEIAPPPVARAAGHALSTRHRVGHLRHALHQRRDPVAGRSRLECPRWAGGGCWPPRPCRRSSSSRCLMPIPESPKWLVQAGAEPEARGSCSVSAARPMPTPRWLPSTRVLKQEEGTFAELFPKAWRLPLADRGRADDRLPTQRHQRHHVLLDRHLLERRRHGKGGHQGRGFPARRGRRGKAAKTLEAAAKRSARHGSPGLPRNCRGVGRQEAQGWRQHCSPPRRRRRRKGCGRHDHASAIGRPRAVPGQGGGNRSGGEREGIQSPSWIGLVNFLATFIAILFVDKTGRKPLLLIGTSCRSSAWLPSVG